MEAVPRLHMLWFALKSSPEGTSFINLKKYIAEFYQEDPDAYTKEVFALETLRNQSMHPTKDGCAIMKRYYSQLHSLQNRFPQLSERGVFTFTWKDLYHNNVNEVTDIRYEMAAVMFNIAATHTQVGASVTRGDVDGMKLACTHFQCAAWTFGELQERYPHVNSGGDFMTTELLVFMQQVSYAQAQECILEKSLIDNRKPNIVAKVTAQIVNYYNAALGALLTAGDDGPIAQVIDSSVYKLWKKYVRFKISYLNCILYLYQGQNSEEHRKMGERVTLYQAAWESLEEARKESKGLPDQSEINESLIFTADVVEAKRKNAKNENEFIYHEAVPDMSTISAVQGANLVNGISFSVTDPEVAGEDIFARLVPMKAHEASSMYSEEKAKLLRKYGTLIDQRDSELATFMGSLTLDNLNINEEKANKLPQGIVDRCAALNANKVAIPDLIAAMSQLAEICTDVELNLKDIGAILSEEERQEQEFQSLSGVQRTPNAHITELTREYQKYAEAHTRAGESNDTLRKAMELHVNNLKILARPLPDIQQAVPRLSSELNTTEIFKDVKLIVNKVNEMKAQRSQFHADLRIAVNEDDITAKVIAHGTDEGLQNLFERELAKHERLTQLLDQNLLAQQNILAALTESYAKAAPVLKTLADVKHKRETFFSSLAASYDVYEDLLAKSAKGLEFYKKLSGNVQKLLTRFKAARDVQSEERQQRLKSVASSAKSAATQAAANTLPMATPPISGGGGGAAPKLRDYLKAKQTNAASVAAAALGDASLGAMSTPYLPPVRPNPLGSENPTQAVCGSYYNSSSGGGASSHHHSVSMGPAAPNEPPPPYSLQQAQYYDPQGIGYSSPLYQQQHIAPPAYTLQASPNSQFTQMQAGMSGLPLAGNSYNNAALQQQQQPQQQYQQAPLPASYDASGYGAAQAFGSLQQAAQQASNYNSYAVSNAAGMTYPPAGAAYSQAAAANSANAYANQQHQTASMYTMSQQQPPQYPGGPPASQPPQYPGGPSVSQPPQYPGGPPATQPLYVATTQQPYEMPAVPPTLQAPNVINPLVMQLHQQQPPPPSQWMAPQAAVSALAQPPAPAPAPAPVPVPAATASTAAAATATTAATTTSSYGTNMSSGGHPGYSYNPQTGKYEYGSGYQQAAASNAHFYGQYTSGTATQLPNVGTTDSVNAHKTNLSTGFDSPVISHTKSQTAEATTDKGNNNNSGTEAAPVSTAEQQQPNISYYTTPYGYHAHNNNASSDNNSSDVQSASYPAAREQQPQAQQPHLQPQPGETNYHQPQQATYMQCGSGPTSNTQTTKSAAEYASSSQQTLSAAAAALKISDPVPEPPKPVAKKNCSNLDLLTDVDFSGDGGSVPPPMLPQPLLQPQKVISPPPSEMAASAVQPAEQEQKIKTATSSLAEEPAKSYTPPLPSPPLSAGAVAALPAVIPLQLSSPVDAPTARKASCDNISICSDLSSLNENFDWDSVSVAAGVSAAGSEKPHSVGNAGTFLLKPTDPFGDEKTLKYFHKEVERHEKLVESLHVKMLNGHTQLSAKWKDLHDLLAKDVGKRTTTIAKLFPEKNRSLDCLPYDHARVKLEKINDDYINAAYIKNLGPGCPNLIISQTPQQNTLNDFWSMLWSQKSRTVVCLHTPNEMLDPYWPQVLDKEAHFDDYSVKCVRVVPLSHCVEYQLKLSMHGADPIIDLTLLQIKLWTKSSASQVLGIAGNALQAHQQRCLEFNAPASPLVLNCLTGSERSEVVAIAACALLATQTKRPVLINVVDVWYRICQQRQQGIRDVAALEESLQIVLQHAHDVLNKRGIVTSYQMKIAPQAASKEKDEIKDPLNDLDPLWKMK